MSSYISSNANRFYAGLENNYGETPGITAQNRFAAVKLTARNQLEKADRRDKTGSRTFAGIPAGLRRVTSFDITTYMTSWSGQAGGPSYGPLFQAGMGAAPLLYAGGTAGSGSSGTSLVFQAAAWAGGGPGCLLQRRDAVCERGRERHRSATECAFSSALPAGEAVAPSISYFPATELPSLSIFDYWDPATALQRIICGAAVDRMSIKLNGDFHQFEFEGIGAGFDRQREFHSGHGAIAELSGGAGDGGVRLLDRAGQYGRGLAGVSPAKFYTVTSGDIPVRQRSGYAGEGIWNESAASDCAGTAIGYGGVQLI